MSGNLWVFPWLYGRKLKLKAKLKSSLSHFSFKALIRRFQHGFQGFNLHHPTFPRLGPDRMIMGLGRSD